MGTPIEWRQTELSLGQVKVVRITPTLLGATGDENSVIPHWGGFLNRNKIYEPVYHESHVRISKKLVLTSPHWEQLRHSTKVKLIISKGKGMLQAVKTVNYSDMQGEASIPQLWYWREARLKKNRQHDSICIKNSNRPKTTQNTHCLGIICVW